MDDELLGEGELLQRENARLIKERDLAHLESTILRNELDMVRIRYQVEMAECMRLRRVVQAYEESKS